MKKLVSLVLLGEFLGFVLCQPSFAQDWRPIAEITKLELNIIAHSTYEPIERVIERTAYFMPSSGAMLRVKFKNGDEGFFIANAVEMDVSHIISEASERNAVWNTEDGLSLGGYNELGQKSTQHVVLTNEEAFEVIVKTLVDRLLSMQIDKKYAYEKTDGLFAKLLQRLQEINWSGEKTNLPGVSKRFTWVSSYGRRYGLPLIDALATLFRNNPQNETLAESLNWSTEYAIKSGDAPAEEFPTIEERKKLGQTLLDLKTASPKHFDLMPDGRLILSIVAPDIVAKIDSLKRD